ncbi:Sulfotransferase family protein [Shimia marina]|uniref:Sulfotransferase domain protein n=2 Tax=Shimia marina TaxID=321267 RepID=A0A0P1EUU6_9RHOB|nr:hypothetical protein SHM7688_03861 [Shimia marina]SFE02482.1 Sulfotransferase family protein [Shimia marina]
MFPNSYVFIVTYGRSGSTLLQNVINALPGYEIRGENAHALFYLFQSWRQISNSGPMNGLRQHNTATASSHPWFGGELVDPDVFGKSLAETFIKTVLQPSEGVSVSGFKEVRYNENLPLLTPYLNFIHRYFPNAKFVFNTRNLDSVAKSGWWQQQPRAQVIRKLSNTEKAFDKYLTAFPDRGLKMHYDDYVADPCSFDRLFDFLNNRLSQEDLDQILGNKLTHAQIPKEKRR